jgi:hypothetical protein
LNNAMSAAHARRAELEKLAADVGISADDFQRLCRGTVMDPPAPPSPPGLSPLRNAAVRFGTGFEGDGPPNCGSVASFVRT